MAHDSHAHAHASAHGGAHAAHGADGGHHGHFIVPKRTLLVVFGLLLFFTLTTVLAANLEEVFAHAFNVEIPQWVNVAVALSIATVKSIIVALYFMQLRYDNPMNGAIAVFTLMVVCSFLGFTMIDLGARGALYDYKARYIVDGGTGGIDRANGENVQGPIAEFSRKKAFDAIDELKKAGTPREQWPRHLKKYAEHLDHDAHAAGAGGEHGAKASTSSSAQQSRIKTGITLPELGGGTEHGHAAPAGGHAAEPAKEGAKGEKPAGH